MTLSWFQIVRLGLVQACLGAIVVLMTSTLNRILAVELALPVILPGLLVALHYGVQITRPSWGFLSDRGGNRTFWILAGMVMLAGGALAAAAAVPVLETAFALGLALSVAAYALIGLGVGACGTSLLALLATATAPRRRPAAATITWLMMIAGIALTAVFAGGFLDPYSHARLFEVVAVVALGAVALAALAIWGIEARVIARPEPEAAPFREGLAEIWAEPRARAFTLFVFLSMTAYFMQELILEPYGGLVFGMSPGETTRMSGAQNGGVFLGMLLVGIAATGLGRGTLRGWVVAGCLGSAVVLGAIALAAPGAAAGAAGRGAGGLQRHVRRRRHRRDDADGRRGPVAARGHPHGPVGREPGHRRRGGGAAGRGPCRCLPSGPAHAHRLRHGLRDRGRALPRRRGHGRAHHGARPRALVPAGSGRMTHAPRHDPRHDL